MFKDSYIGRSLDLLYSHSFLIRRGILLALALFVAGYLLWDYALKYPVYRSFYGTFKRQSIDISSQETKLKLPRDIPEATITGNDFKVKLSLLNKYSVNARVLNVSYHDFWGMYTRGSRGLPVLDEVAPFDLAISFGKAGKEYFDSIETTTDYRFLEAHIQPGKVKKNAFNTDEIQNLYIIPATNRIKKGLATLQKGDLVSLEGYMVTLQSETGEIKPKLPGMENIINKVKIMSPGKNENKEGQFLYLIRLATKNHLFE